MKHMKKSSIVVMVPYPAQGHVSPMQKLASVFVSNGFQPVIVLPQHIHKKITNDEDEMIKWVGLPDGLELENKTSPDFFAIESAMEKSMPKHFEELLLLLQQHDDVCLVVVDLLASWAIEVADKFGIPSAGFWPAMLSSYLLIAAIPHMLQTGLISDIGLPQGVGKITFLPDLPTFSTDGLPWLIGTVAARKARFKFWVRTLERSRTLKWLLVNSFPNESKIEVQPIASQIVNKCSTQSVLPIGPINICRHDLQLTKTLSFWEEDLSCLKWLTSQNDNSVVYISFGSWVNPIGESNLKNLALALEASKRPFIWVLRSTWREGLPIGFLERVLKHNRGRVVSWAPQIEILQHKSVGCFITHCGWNSTLEALQSQKKMLCYPVAGDQFVNCAYIVEVWKVGLRLNGLGPKDVEEGISRVMEDIEMGTRLMKLYERIFMQMKRDNNNNNKKGGILQAFIDHLIKRAPSTFHEQNAS